MRIWCLQVLCLHVCARSCAGRWENSSFWFPFLTFASRFPWTSAPGSCFYLLSVIEIMVLVLMLLPPFLKQSIQPPVWSWFFLVQDKQTLGPEFLKGLTNLQFTNDPIEILFSGEESQPCCLTSKAGLVTSCIIKLGESWRQLGAQSVFRFFHCTNWKIKNRLKTGLFATGFQNVLWRYFFKLPSLNPVQRSARLIRNPHLVSSTVETDAQMQHSWNHSRIPCGQHWNYPGNENA